MEFVEPAEARHMPGLKLVQTVGFPGPWGQAVKKILELKHVNFIPVAQYAGKENADLVAWIGVRNAPTIIADGRPPLTRWQDQIMFAETIVPEPAILPRNSLDRVTVFGICNELAGEWGFGWCRRIMLFDDVYKADEDGSVRTNPVLMTMAAEYGYLDSTAVAAPQRCVDILRMLTVQLSLQRSRGSDFLVGASLTAADVYWATFSTMLEPLSNEFCQISDELRASRTVRHPEIVAAKDPLLLSHRDMIFRKFLGRLEF